MKSVAVAMVIAASVALAGCESDDDDDDALSESVTVTISHGGYDFSTGTSGWSINYDGETVSWQPDGSTNPDYPRDVNLWWRPANDGRTKDMGAVSLSSVTSVPSTWDASPNIPALIVGHVIVAECLDGYVKFRVVSVDAASALWEVEVEYEFSATGTFN